MKVSITLTPAVSDQFETARKRKDKMDKAKIDNARNEYVDYIEDLCLAVDEMFGILRQVPKPEPKFKVGDLVIFPVEVYGYEVIIHGQVVAVREYEWDDGVDYQYEVRIMKDGAITGDSDRFDECELELDK